MYLHLSVSDYLFQKVGLQLRLILCVAFDPKADTLRCFFFPHRFLFASFLQSFILLFLIYLLINFLLKPPLRGMFMQIQRA